jgi:hypothetical protein
MNNFGGLKAHPEIKQLIDTESELKARIGEYLFNEEGHDKIPFILPAPAEEMARHRANPDGYKLMFPQILLHLRRLRHPGSGQVGVEVTCSDSDLEVLCRANLETFARKQIAAQRMAV